MRAEVIALACALPAEQGVPLSRWSSAELAREAVTRGIVEQISGVTVWRWLSEDAIKPWQHRSWIFPRDPLFAERAGPILDLYAGYWQGERLHPGDYVVCADEKPSIQARARKHRTLPPAPGSPQKVEHEYERMGALCYLAAWDARRAKIFDRCAPKDGIEPFDALVDQFKGGTPPRLDRDVAHRAIVFLEDRRVLYEPVEVEMPEHCVESVLSIREFLTALLVQGGIADELADSLRAMRTACRKFVTTVSDEGPGGRLVVPPDVRYGMGANWEFNQALGELRGVFGLHIGQLAVRYGVDVPEPLSRILPLDPATDESER